MIAITGNTYPVKEELKALGARWNGERKAWMVAPDKAEIARRIVAGAPAKVARPSHGFSRRSRPSCWTCRDMHDGGTICRDCGQED